MTKFRISAHNLMIEVGRHCNIKVEDRLCKHCNYDTIENEMHFLLECPKYKTLREIMLNKVESSYCNFGQLNHIDQFRLIMTSTLEDIIYALAEYLFKATELRITPS